MAHSTLSTPLLPLDKYTTAYLLRFIPMEERRAIAFRLGHYRGNDNDHHHSLPYADELTRPAMYISLVDKEGGRPHEVIAYLSYATNAMTIVDILLFIKAMKMRHEQLYEMTKVYLTNIAFERLQGSWIVCHCSFMDRLISFVGTSTILASSGFWKMANTPYMSIWLYDLVRGGSIVAADIPHIVANSSDTAIVSYASFVFSELFVDAIKRSAYMLLSDEHSINVFVNVFREGAKYRL